MSLKKKILVIFVVLAVSITLIIYFIIIPTVSDIRNISDKIITEKEDLEIKYKKGQLMKKISKDFETIKPEKDKLNSIFLNEGDELDFVMALEKIAEKYNLDQSVKINQKGIKKNNDIITLPITVEASGEFISALKFLYDIEKMNYYFNIEKISMIVKSSDTGIIKIALTGNIFSRAIKVNDK